MAASLTVQGHGGSFDPHASEGPASVLALYQVKALLLALGAWGISSLFAQGGCSCIICGMVLPYGVNGAVPHLMTFLPADSGLCVGTLGYGR